ncbi:hypothetical protein Q1695_010193 [Nippostrongylus brasiliensis]|nr:hypothetical protein Q1695_010193 [Nippostrongylus brasiliensis]
MPDTTSRDRVCFTARTLGIVLLLLVNVLWVLSSELTRFIFIDEDFKRPFFTAYVKTCMLTVYMVRFLVFEKPQQSMEGFETMTSDSENDADRVESSTRSVRFAEHREIRRMPADEADDARQARLPYSPPIFDCNISFNIPSHIKYTVFFFAPMWLVCSFSYQTALMFTSVSALNLISSSASLFVLVFSICFPSSESSFTLVKAFLVAVNLGGVFVVSQFTTSLRGALFAQLSAVAYALYITLYTRYQERNGEISINLMFGTIGVLAVFIGTPLLYVFDILNVEELHPLPNTEQIGSIVLSAVFGTLLGDYLWLTAAGLTDALSASLAMTLAIPFSFMADAVIRGQPPSGVQLLAAIPITASFIGAAVVDHRKSTAPSSDSRRQSADEDGAALLDDDYN